MRFWNLPVLALFALILPSALLAQAPEAEPTSLRPGDAIRITVWRQPELSGEFTVSEAGTIQHPLYQEVAVAGVPVSEARARVRAYLSRLEENPQFVVEPLLRVSVGGEVRQPSLYRLSPETTIAQAVAMAGGVSERANMQTVQLLRGGQQITVDLTSSEAGMAQAPIRSGDQIYVERRRSFFREYVVPATSVTAAAASIINIILRNR